MGDNSIVFIGKQVLLEGELRAARVVVKDGKILEVVEAADGDGYQVNQRSHARTLSGFLFP